MTGPSFASHELFRRATASVVSSAEEQIKIERAIGRTILDRLANKDTDLLHSYRAIGGTDPAVEHIFTDMNPEIAKINFENVKKNAATAVNKPGVAAAKRDTIKDAESSIRR